ncbi:Proline oxidase [Macrophomina phaseolina MS6]|uniref:Proline dehydrogenase n=1 Tax=Macrophomina phaseolina (strain MS6) TaxID=1126212 RepID=K2RNA4_MACPH|nr:Proline oxidase [Macrophomina phaseolina MS6]
MRSAPARPLRTSRNITTVSLKADTTPAKASGRSTAADTPPLRPLSALPTSTLLRSACINAISSKPFLLSPAIAILSVLCKPNRGLLFNVDRNPLLHAILKGTFYKQFCAGENAAEVTRTIRQLRRLGFGGTILTYAKETVFDHRTNTQHGLGVASGDGDEGAAEQHCDAIAAWADGTLRTVDLLEEGDQLALK